MSTIPEKTQEEDRVVATVSRWLARHLADEELRWELERVSPGELGTDQAEAVEELRFELGEERDRAELEMVARETLEALALGG